MEKFKYLYAMLVKMIFSVLLLEYLIPNGQSWFSEVLLPDNNINSNAE